MPGLEETLRAFQVRSPWTQLSVLLAPVPGLGSKTVLQVLQAGDIATALAVAASFGEQAG
jgi:hypothetical protein